MSWAGWTIYIPKWLPDYYPNDPWEIQQFPPQFDASGNREGQYLRPMQSFRGGKNRRTNGHIRHLGAGRCWELFSTPEYECLKTSAMAVRLLAAGRYPI